MSNTTEISLLLAVKLTDGELIDYGKQLADIEQQAEALREEKKKSAASFKVKLDDLASEIAELSKKIADGSEPRDVFCLVHLGKPAGHKTCQRSDTGETVWIRPLTAAEMQTEMFEHDTTST